MTTDPTAPPDANGLREAVERGLRKCRVEDGSPVSLIRDSDVPHIVHMVTTEILAAPEAALTAGEESVVDLVQEYADLHPIDVQEEPDLPVVRCVAYEPLIEFLIERGAALSVASESWSDLPATPAADDASEGLSEAEREALSIALHGKGREDWLTGGPLIEAVERIVAARESAAATRARAEGAADALRGAAHHANEITCGYASDRIRSLQAIRKWLRDRADSIARSDAAPRTGGES